MRGRSPYIVSAFRQTVTVRLKLGSCKGGPADQPDRQQCQRRQAVGRVAGQHADQEDGSAGQHDARGPRIAPRAERPRKARLAPAQDDERQAAHGVVRRQEERRHRHQPLERPGHDQDDRHRRRHERRDARRAAGVDGRGARPEQPVAAHGEQDARPDHHDGVEQRRQRDERQHRDRLGAAARRG